MLVGSLILSATSKTLGTPKGLGLNLSIGVRVGSLSHVSEKLFHQLSDLTVSVIPCWIRINLLVLECLGNLVN